MMGDLYQHPVFFECESLEEHLTRVENYFRIRRKSGGGECGPLTRVEENVYSVAFRNKKDQQRVLQRSEHVLDLEDRSLVFTVRESLESDSSSHLTTLTSARAVTFGSVSNDKFTVDVHHKDQDQDSTTMRLVLLGKTGSGKSHLGNTIFGEEHFATYASSNSGTMKCQTETKTVSGRSITLIDTPGFFDTGRSEEDLKPEMVRCMTECAPGPHAFLIVLKVEKFTQQEQDVIKKICQDFSEDAMKYAAVVFTHGDQLPEGTRIEEFISQNKELSNLVEKCGGRCHVVDNKYWKYNKEDDYRSNRFQVAEILRTIDKISEANNGSCYTNEMLQKIESELQKEEELIRKSSANMSAEQIAIEAKKGVMNKLLIIFAGTATGVLVGAFLGVAKMVTLTFLNLQEHTGVTVSLAAQKGLEGGWLGYAAAEQSESASEAIQKAAKAVMEHAVK